MLDLGANVDCGAEHLFQFAVMGEVFARVMLGVAKPRVGLLNVGTEELKGDDVVRGAAAMLRDSTLPIDFHGFVEGTDVTEGVVDVVVTDGFTGNVALKIAEGTAAMFTAALREAIRGGGWRAKLGYLLAKPAFARCASKFDPARYNGAMFLGLNGVVVKSHGGTDALGFAPRSPSRPIWSARAPTRGSSRRWATRPVRRPGRPRGGVLTAHAEIRRAWRRRLSAGAGDDQRRAGADRRHLRRVDPRAHRHRPAPSRGRGRADLRSRRRGRAQGAGAGRVSARRTST